MSKSQKEQEAQWRRVEVDCDMNVAEAITAVLMEQGALGIDVQDDETRAIPGKEVEPTGRAQVGATFAKKPGLEAEIARALSVVAEHLEEAKDLSLSWSDVEDEDYNAAFKASWGPTQVGHRAWVVPSWVEGFEPPADAIVITIDPGQAFGTGTHETTQLCARALESRCAGKRRMLDVGTGSGVLSILAHKLGVPEIVATEIDPHALKVGVENAALNNAEAITFFGDGPDEHGEFDLVVANILAEILLPLAPAISSAVAKGGTLLLCGLLTSQEQEVLDAYRAFGLRQQSRSQEGDWVLLELVR